jgi:prepilin-type N-terminal cleavage/methylation domain-containing protein/prepilin-type processing-associated H-X9-DG protein
MAVPERPTRRGFTLIELLVVVAIIALLISIMLPSLKCAREKARAAKCGVQLRGLGRGMLSYTSENNEWIPGINTSGVAAYVAGRNQDVGALRSPGTPVQTYDWISPTLRHETELGNNRAERFQTMINEYRCPSFQGLTIDFLYPAGLSASPDREDFTEDIIATYSPLSYLMPAHFQWWGQDWAGAVAAYGTSTAGRPFPVYAKVSGEDFAAVHNGGYQSRVDKLGPTADKIAAADGMRYLTEDDWIDFDVSPSASWFGSFASNGAWWGGSQAYGVKDGSTNWDGTAVHPDGGGPEAQGRNLVWSYRHGCSSLGSLTEGARDNSGELNAMFFDGHVARLDDRASRNIKYWYPTGTTVQSAGESLTDVPVGSKVP